MHAHVGGHVLAQIIDADVHDLAAVQRAASFFRRGGRVRGHAAELEDHARVGQRTVHQAVVNVGMPRQAEIDAVETPLTHHEGLAGAAFFGGTAEVNDSSRFAALL